MGNNIIGCALLLGILIFLPEPSKGLSEYGTPCRKHGECKTEWCSKELHTCGCPSHKSGRHVVLIQFFDKAHKKCVTAVGKACTLERNENDILPPLECVRHADCMAVRKAPVSTQIFGECVCREGYRKTDNHLCALPHETGISEQQVHTEDANLGDSKKESDGGWSLSKSNSSPVQATFMSGLLPLCTTLIHYFTIK